MLQKDTNIFIKLSLAILLTVSANSSASTVCSINCPDTGAGKGPAVPQIVELISLDGGGLLLDNEGLIILDNEIYNNLSGLTINSPTPVYQGLSALPPGIIIPDVLELITISYTADFSGTGALSDYVLLRQFEGNTVLNLTATDGILVMDTNALFAVPLPGAIIFLLSGIVVLFSFGAKSKNIK